MKAGQRVLFFVKQGRIERRLSGTVIAFNDVLAEVVPDGKKNALKVPINQLYEVNK